MDFREDFFEKHARRGGRESHEKKEEGSCNEKMLNEVGQFGTCNKFGYMMKMEITHVTILPHLTLLTMSGITWIFRRIFLKSMQHPFFGLPGLFDNSIQGKCLCICWNKSYVDPQTVEQFNRENHVFKHRRRRKKEEIPCERLVSTTKQERKQPIFDIQ